jgi:Flp pilus assembly pilin Flp
MLGLFVWMQTQVMTSSLRREEGQGLTEYALILVFVAIVAIAALTFLGGRITSVISKVAGSLT